MRVELHQDHPRVLVLRLGWRDLVRLLWGDVVRAPDGKNREIAVVYGKPARR